MIVRIKKEMNFSIISNDALHDERLSYGARGILSYLLTLPSNWNVSIAHLVSKSRKDGRDKVTGLFSELMELGYAERKEVREKGRFKGYEYTVYEKPLKTGSEEPLKTSESGLPKTASPNTENPNTENRTLIITNNNKNLKEKEEEKIHCSNEQGYAKNTLPKTSAKSKTKQELKPKEISLTDKFQGLLVNTRIGMKHKPVKVISPSDRQYGMLGEVAELVQTYCNDFGMDFTLGAYEYLSIAIPLMGKLYAINKFKTFNEKVYEIKQSKIDIDADPNFARTRTLYARYIEKVKERAGIEPNYLEPRSYVHFVWALRDIVEAKAKVSEWLEAQFSELEFLGAIPSHYQLNGDNAKKRYEAYMIQTKAKLSKETDGLSLASEENSDYFQMLKKRSQTNESKDE